MELDLNKYVYIKPTIKRRIEQDGEHSDHHRIVSEISASLGVPIYACIVYYRDLYGNSEWIENSLNSLQKMYGYSRIVEEGSKE